MGAPVAHRMTGGLGCDGEDLARIETDVAQGAGIESTERSAGLVECRAALPPGEELGERVGGVGSVHGCVLSRIASYAPGRSACVPRRGNALATQPAPGWRLQ